MTNDIREKAQALINYLRKESDYKDLEFVQEFIELKAALIPSKEEVVDYLLSVNLDMSYGLNKYEVSHYIKLAIEELRK